MDKNLKSYYNKINFAFTLAEVLITLGIIGVVAALTIPTLLKSTNDLEFKSAWKKSYSVLQSAYTFLKSENGGTTISGMGITNNATFAQAFKPYLKVMRDEPNLALILMSDGSQYVTKMKTMNGNVGYVQVGIQNNAYFLVLNDGTFFIFEYTGGDANNAGGFNGANLYAVVYNSNHIFVDVNGVKPPNILGRDIFGVMIYNNNLIPFGAYMSGITVPTPGGPIQNTCTTSTTGHSCSAEYLVN